MEAYKFETTVSENGIIQLPEIAKFANRTIEIFIVIKQQDSQTDTIKKQTPEQFAHKWRGFLKGCNPDDLKFQIVDDFEWEACSLSRHQAFMDYLEQVRHRGNQEGTISIEEVRNRLDTSHEANGDSVTS